MEHEIEIIQMPDMSSNLQSDHFNFFITTLLEKTVKLRLAVGHKFVHYKKAVVDSRPAL